MTQDDHEILWLGVVPLLLSGLLLLGTDQMAWGIVGVGFAATMLAFVLTGQFKRFSLRTMFIATTLVAVVLGLGVWMAF